MKRRFVSLSVKVSILIVIMMLSVSALQLAISSDTYQKTVFQPYLDKLNHAEIPEENLTPYMDYFLKSILSDDSVESLSAIPPEDRNDRVTDWMFTHPSMANQEATIYFDYIDVDYCIYDIWRINGMNSVAVELWKNQVPYRVITWSMSMFNNTDGGETDDYSSFGLQEAYFPELSAESFSSAGRFQTNGLTLYVRCARFGLEDGGEYRIWMTYDMTEVYREYRHFLIRSALSALGLTAAMSILCVFILRRNLVRPITQITQTTKDFMAEEDGTYSENKISRVVTRDHSEINDLNNNVRFMQEQIVENTKNLAHMTAEKERIDTELNLAADIQINMLPRIFPPFPERKEFGLFASMTPAKEVGGDFYDFFLIDSDHLALVMADVSGKGIPAALFMMVSKVLIKTQLVSGCDPATALERVNQQLSERNTSMMFVTVWLAVLEISSGKGLACNAGHEHPAIRRAGGEFELLQYKHNLFVGGVKKAKYQNRSFELRPGDCVFVYTDGVPEIANAAGKMFGEERMIDTLNQCPDAEPEALIRHVHDAVYRFADNAPQSDDITMLCCKYYGTKG